MQVDQVRGGRTGLVATYPLRSDGSVFCHTSAVRRLQRMQGTYIT